MRRSRLVLLALLVVMTFVVVVGCRYRGYLAGLLPGAAAVSAGSCLPHAVSASAALTASASGLRRVLVMRIASIGGSPAGVAWVSGWLVLDGRQGHGHADSR